MIVGEVVCRGGLRMGREVDTIASKGTNTIEKNNTTINIEDIAIFSSYEILEDGTRIFSAED